MTSALEGPICEVTASSTTVQCTPSSDCSDFNDKGPRLGQDGLNRISGPTESIAEVVTAESVNSYTKYGAVDVLIMNDQIQQEL